MSTTVANKRQFKRLPKHVVPLLYKITLKPDLVNFVFTGRESIHVKINNQTGEIVLNVRDIVITDATFQSTCHSNAIKGSIDINKETEKAYIRFNQDLMPGDGYLNLAFQGTLNDKMAGFYRSRYKSSATGEERFAAITMLAPDEARRVFPCWDEPAIKAKFKVTVIAPKDRNVFSNTMEEGEEIDPNDENLKIVIFKTTPIMSTYLVAVIVGEYEYLETKAGSNGTIIRVLTPVGKRNQGAFALDIAARSLTFLEEYFKIPYPLEKLYHVPVNDFAYFAMENWGLIVYRETSLLIDEGNTSSAIKQETASTIVHETAHQWFGNLVTMEWWTDLWLNEGFASFMQYVVVDALHPEFDFWTQFPVDATLLALDTDSSHRSHSIQVLVNAPSDVLALFDEISYEKGCSVIRMLYNWIGPEAFRVGMKNYLTEYSYKNAVTNDLWQALEESSKKPVLKAISTWTLKMGFPVINISMKSQGSGVVLNLTQERFTIDGKLTDSETNNLWMVPISVITSKNPKETIDLDLMTGKSMKATLENVSSNDWIKLNPSWIGFFRVNYQEDMLELLGQGIRDKSLGPVDRLQIIDDLSALNLAGKVPVSRVLAMLDNYVDEDDYIPWFGIDQCLGRIGALLAYTNHQSLFHQFGRNLLAKIYQKVGFDKKPNEPFTRGLLRAIILERLVNLKDEQVLTEAKKRFESHLNGEHLDPDLRTIAYKAIASCGDKVAYEKLFKLYHDVDLHEERMRIANSLGSTRNESDIQRVLEFAFSERVRSQDAWNVIISVAVTPEGRRHAWDFFKRNFQQIKDRYGSTRSSHRLIQKINQSFASDEVADDIENFFKLNEFSGLEDRIYRAVEKIRTNAAWIRRESETLREYLSSKTY